ncbi:hypothetical protein LPB86_05190 [Pedobacter sp. MC2016-14]|uniref:hypothetical protein n=1 Tax=Pedobacter sp. MC2016-14 TaxID=2897327 RepID=UPI001E28E29D|nr:hypothetical protein [Pedobacter sp. MC2016-14]MCD0487612.1 hypothetical protein [Pedobacter sp. MC2016-14]
MRAFIPFTLTAAIASGVILAAIDMKNPTIGIGISLVALAFFALYYFGRAKKLHAQKQKERLFYQYFINQQSRRSF